MEFSQLDTTIRDAARRGDLCNLLNAPESSGESDPTGLAPAILRLATTKDSDGRTLLYDAVVGGDVDACKRVLEMRDVKGRTASDVRMRDDGGWTPLMSACSSNRADVAAWLLDSGAELDDKHRDLFYAASKGDARLMEVVCGSSGGRAGVDILTLRGPVGPGGATLLHRAVGAGNVDVVRWLVGRMREAGTDVGAYVAEAKDGAGETVEDVLRESWGDRDERGRDVRAALEGR